MAITVILIMASLCLRLRSQSSNSYSSGYEAVPQEENHSLLTNRPKVRKTIRNTHALPSDSEPEDEEVLFTANVNTPMIA